MKKVNYYYITAGLFAILFSITHELNGLQRVIPALSSGALDISAVTTINYIWHVITAENFIFGIAFIIMAFYRDRKNVRFSAWLICSILITRLFVIVGTTLIMTGGQINDLIIDIIAIVIYTAIILVGTRAKSDKKR
nr:hypothetical protein [uncultured Macellibacteroides sp.]